MTKNRTISKILDQSTTLVGPITVGNSTVNATVNSTAFTGTANNATNLGGTAASGYQTTAGLSANVAKLTANDSTNLGGSAASAYQLNSTLAANVAIMTANNANNLGTVAAASYVKNTDSRTLSGVLAFSGNTSFTGANVQANGSTVTIGNSTIYVLANSTVINVGGNTINSTVWSGQALTANNATNLGGTAASGYQTTAGLAAAVLILPANNASYLGGTIASSYQLNSTLSANVATMTANNSNYLGTVAAASYQLNSTLVANVATMTANNATYLGGTVASGYQTTAGLSAAVAGLGYQTTSGLSAAVAALTANNATYLNGVAASGYQTTAGLTAAVALLTSNTATNLLQYATSADSNTDFQNTYAGTRRWTETGGSTNAPATGWWMIDNMRHTNGASYWGVQLAYGWESNANKLYMRNVSAGVFSAWNQIWTAGDVVPANNASYLGGVAAASYVQNTDSRTLSGNLNFTGANNWFTTGWSIKDSCWAADQTLVVGNTSLSAWVKLTPAKIEVMANCIINTSGYFFNGVAVGGGGALTNTSNFWANSGTAGIGVDTYWAAAGYTALTDAATIAVNMANGINYSVTLAGNRTLGWPTNIKVGQSGYISVLIDATGTRTLSYFSNSTFGYKFDAATAPVVDPVANHRSLLFYHVFQANTILITMPLAGCQ